MGGSAWSAQDPQELRNAFISYYHPLPAQYFGSPLNICVKSTYTSDYVAMHE